MDDARVPPRQPPARQRRRRRRPGDAPLTGPTLRFNRDARDLPRPARACGATLDGAPRRRYGSRSTVRAGQTLTLGARRRRRRCAPISPCAAASTSPRLSRQPRDLHARAASAATRGRALRAGDVLHLGRASRRDAPRRAAADARPQLTHAWDDRRALRPARRARFLHRPTTSTMLFATDWKVHYNSSRTGVRLIGPKPQWARARRRRGRPASVEHPRQRLRDRRDRLHRRHADHPRPRRPEPRRLRLPGRRHRRPSCGRSASSRPATRVRFVPRDVDDAAAQRASAGRADRALLDAARRRRHAAPRAEPRRSCAITAARGDAPAVVYRRQGDDYLLVEYGPLVLDLELRFRVHALMLRLRAHGAARHHRSHARHPLAAGPLRRRARCRSATLLDALRRRPRTSCRPSTTSRSRRASCTCRCRGTTRRPSSRSRKYMQLGARRRALVPEQHRVHPPHQRPRHRSSDVQRIVFDASYLVLGLGDVYLGAPVATPLDPRHRLVTTKYNPARTWTPRERGRHRRRLPVHLRHGGAGRLPVRRPHRAGVEPLSRRPRDFERRQAVAAALLRPDPLLPGERTTSCSNGARDFPHGRRDAAASSRRRSAWPTTARFLADNAAEHRRLQGAPAGAPSTPSAHAGQRRGEFDRVAALIEDAVADDAATSTLPAGCEAGRGAARRQRLEDRGRSRASASPPGDTLRRRSSR